mgnify:CR=1 FL=1
MASYNRVLLMGNLTRDPELRQTSSNNPVANIGLAVNRSYTTKSGERREEATFIDCEAWGRTAEVMSKYLKKGRPVFVDGRLKLDEWEDREGNRRHKLKVVIEQFQFINSNPNRSDDSDSHDDQEMGDVYESDHENLTDDSIPF